MFPVISEMMSIPHSQFLSNLQIQNCPAQPRGIARAPQRLCPASGKGPPASPQSSLPSPLIAWFREVSTGPLKTTTRW